MSETRKNHLTIDGGQGRDDDHVVASYKPIPESDTDFRKSKSSLSKSKEKVSAEEEKLLDKEEEAKITTRVDMADAKYVVEDHRNGDAKIELDANKRQFSGLTKEELMKYADDPFWVRLRWFMFILFWALWLCMLAGAVIIIVQAPKCPPPPPKTWYQKGPLVDMSSVESFNGLEKELPLLQEYQVQGIFTHVCKDTYEVLEDTNCLQQFKEFVTKAKSYGVKVIVDLTANFVSVTHSWFALSENRSTGYEDYFIWGKGKDYLEDGKPTLPNNWVSKLDIPAWTYSEVRKEYYLHQFAVDQPDLNFTNPEVVKRFDEVLKLWMQAGADGVRLHNARNLLVNSSLVDELHRRTGAAVGSTHSEYVFWQHLHTTDHPGLAPLLAHWAHLVDHTAPATGTGETVFTLAENQRPEMFLMGLNVSGLRPPSAAPLPLEAVDELLSGLRTVLPHWPAVQLVEDDESDMAPFAAVLPAAPVLKLEQLLAGDNATDSVRAGHLWSIRQDVSVEHGQYSLANFTATNSTDKLIACARWKALHTGYAAVYNPNSEAARANLTGFGSMPSEISVHYASSAVKLFTKYTNNMPLQSADILVPGKSAILLSYVPVATVEN